MAVYQFSALADGQAISFNPNTDVLYFDEWFISAGWLRVTAEGANLRIGFDPALGSKDVLLLNVSIQQLATSNTLFADGSQLLYGDNSPGSAGDNGANSLTGTDNSDQLAGFGGADTLNGGLGDDQYFVSTGDTIIDSGGYDRVFSDVSWTLGATLEYLQLTGTAAGTLNGNALDNILIGNDADNSSINGRAGNDEMYGMGGNDTFDMSSTGASSYGNDYIDGGSGIDTIDFGTNARSAVVVDLEVGRMNGGGDAGAGSANVYSIENFVGGGFTDHATGTAGANFLYGGGGNDSLIGAGGQDTLEGAAGADRYIFNVAPGEADADTIVGFASGSDKMVLTPGAFTNVGAFGNFAAGDPRFAAGAGFNSGRDASDRVVYNTTTGQLWYDSDGNGAGPARLIATLQGAPAIVASDIAVGETGTLVNGTSGNDSLHGTTSSDTLDGLGGNDTIAGDTGNDLMIGGAGNDSLVGHEGTDSLSGGDGNDTLNGASGVDEWGGGEPEWFWNGEAYEQLPGDILNGGLGDDVYLAQENDVIVDAGGIDSIRTDANAYVLGAGFENLTFQSFARFFDGEGYFIDFGGNELDNVITISGLWVNSASELDGGDGNDTLYGSGGTTTFRFSLGSGDYGHDELHGGGVGIIDFSDARSAFVADLVAGTLTGGGTGGSGSATLFNISLAIGGAYDDVIIGSGWGKYGPGDSYGGGGNDTMEGRSDQSTILHGDAGNDRLVVRGEDYLYGGEGSDAFVFGRAPVVPSEYWNAGIGDFVSGNDKIVLDAAFHSNIGASGNFASGDQRFYAAAGATSGHDATDRVIYDTSSGILYYDADGSGSGAAKVIGSLVQGTALTATDIVVEGGSPNLVVVGTAGNDTLSGGPGNDTLAGRGGNDRLDGGAGVDTADYAAAGNGVIAEIWKATAAADGEGGADALIGIENLIGGASDDLLAGDGNVNDLRGGSGQDTLVGGGDADSLSGEAGNDILRGGGGNDTVDGGAGTDTLDYSTVANGVTVEIWRGTVGSDGEGGADALLGIENVFGTLSGDSLVGDEGANSLFGNTGNDTLIGGGGADSLNGESGNDLLRGGGGNDTLNGASGTDTADYSTVANAVTVEIWKGTASNDGQGGADMLVGIENAFGSLAGDFLVGNEGVNGLFGNTGNDTIRGGGGTDSLVGEGGNDVLDGGTGSDTLSGSGGQDAFRFQSALGASNVDQINDFSVADDTIQLESAVFASFTPGSVAAGNFVSGPGQSVAADADDYLIYDSASGALYYDADGSGSGSSAVQFATLIGAPAITSADFNVI